MHLYTLLNIDLQVGSRISTGVIRAVDDDQPGPFSTIEYLVKPGSKFSEYVAFENPLEGSLILTKRLDYETLRDFEVHIYRYFQLF